MNKLIWKLTWGGIYKTFLKSQAVQVSSRSRHRDPTQEGILVRTFREFTVKSGKQWWKQWLQYSVASSVTHLWSALHISKEDIPIHSPLGRQAGFIEGSPALLVRSQMKHENHDMQKNKNNQGTSMEQFVTMSKNST